MLKSLGLAAMILFAAMSHASAQLVLFSGAGYVTASTGQCAGEGIFQTSFMLGAYMPANLGSNGPGAQFTHTSLPQFVKPHATALVSTEGLYTSYLKVSGTTITPLEVKTYKPLVKLKSKPAVIDVNTQNVELEVSIKNGQGAPNCDFTLQINAVRRAS